MDLVELVKALLIGIVEGITEWLPISSTGHMILFDEFVKMNVSKEFRELFRVVIQLGAIMAVIILYFHRLNPFSSRKDSSQRRATLNLWAKVIVACIPAAIVGFLLDDWADAHFYNAPVVACALIVYGVAFIIIERLQGKKDGEKFESNHGHGRHARTPESESPEAGIGTEELTSLSFARAFIIGLFQCLAIIPGTSRSGSTILGGRILGVSRRMAAEFSFFLAIPVMFGWSLLKVVKGFVLDGLTLTTTEWGVFAAGIVVAFVVSAIAIKFLMGFIKKHSFEAFGWYRIVLGILVLAFFAVTGSIIGPLEGF
jgi:undecaprenyl-diphosphatase